VAREGPGVAPPAAGLSRVLAGPAARDLTPGCGRPAVRPALRRPASPRVRHVARGGPEGYSPPATGYELPATTVQRGAFRSPGRLP
jgi:hypothetical protein